MHGISFQYTIFGCMMNSFLFHNLSNLSFSRTVWPIENPKYSHIRWRFFKGRIHRLWVFTSITLRTSHKKNHQWWWPQQLTVWVESISTAWPLVQILWDFFNACRWLYVSFLSLTTRRYLMITSRWFGRGLHLSREGIHRLGHVQSLDSRSRCLFRDRSRKSPGSHFWYGEEPEINQPDPKKISENGSEILSKTFTSYICVTIYVNFSSAAGYLIKIRFLTLKIFLRSLKTVKKHREKPSWSLILTVIT